VTKEIIKKKKDHKVVAVGNVYNKVFRLTCNRMQSLKVESIIICLSCEVKNEILKDAPVCLIV
jgi:hypothetical protein